MKRIDDGLELLQFFTTREWIFDSTNFLGLITLQSPLDKILYPIDFDAVTVEEYMRRCILGARQYCMKEDLKTLPRCRRVQKL